MLKRDNRGQLQIAETVLAITFILIMALAIIGVTTDLSQPTQSQSWLKKRAYNILASADELELLRPSVYLIENSTFSQAASFYQQKLKVFIESQLTQNYGYLVTATHYDAETLTVKKTYIIITSNTLSSQTTESIGAAYLLTGYSSSKYGIYNTTFVVYLYIQAFG